jgi:microcompartment protein CcmK/EutM
MIKRLTDEPKKLAEVRPDLPFPSGLQPVLDAALSRTPAERYQTVAKFADDVLGVVQLVRATRGGVAPATREVVEGRTQLLDSHETRAQAARRATQPKPKRSLVPVLIGVVVVLGAGGGGWLLLGRNTSAAQNDSTRQTPLDTGKVATTPDTTGTTGTTRPPPAGNSGQPVVRDSAKATVPANPVATIDVRHAFDLLDDMMMNRLTAGTAAWIRDSALKFYNAPGITQKDKAYAAFVTANAMFNLNDRTRGCGWVQTAIRLDPTNSAYTGLRAQCQD